jgi:hypothetical protein
MPPLAVAKNEAGRVVGSHRICWAIVDVDSVTSGESAGLTVLNVDHTASGVRREIEVLSRRAVSGCLISPGVPRDR